MLGASRRPLTEPERRFLRSKIRSLTARGGSSVVALPVAGGVVLILWLWTILASDVNWIIVTAFWLIAGAGIALWVRRDMHIHGRDFETMSRASNRR
jgi:hypothetical protein